MPITSFPAEQVLIEHGKEVLLETAALHRLGSQYVAVDRRGRTDFPIVSGSSVLYDHPEWFSNGFRAKVLKRLIAR